MSEARRVMVLYGLGFNCEEETEAAYALIGAKPKRVHASDFLKQQRGAYLSEFDVLHFSGGFSFGDLHGAGYLFAEHLRSSEVWNELTAFLRGGGRVLGVCNGFQVLVRAGLIPNFSGEFTPEVSLEANVPSGFTNQWVRCKPSGAAVKSLGTDVYEFPIRHAEGRLTFTTDALRDRAVREGRIVLQYDGERLNPNGSAENAAALLSQDGRVLGMMPHPEAFLSPYNHPAWASRMDVREPDGLRFLRAWLERGDWS
jgi:phosphoribosylformylglycinamidine synthase subunit PurQ / glutaminase